MKVFACVLTFLVISVTAFDSGKFLNDHCEGSSNLIFSFVKLSQKDTTEIQQSNFVISNATTVSFQHATLLVNDAFFEKFPQATSIIFENCVADMNTESKRAVAPHRNLTTLSFKSSTVKIGQGLKSLTNVTSLLFDSSQLSSHGLENSFFQQFPELTYFSFRNGGYCLVYNYAFRGLRKLKNIEMSGNELHFFELAFQEANSLERLHLDSNKLDQIPTALLTSSIQFLSFRNNLLRIITKNMLQRLSGLSELYLNDNKIEQISGEAFTNLVQLRICHLENNLITNITRDHFKKNQYISYLDISGNNFEKVADDTFDDLINLEYLKY